MAGGSQVTEIAATQRVANARHMAAALGLLNLVAIPLVFTLAARPAAAVAVLLAFTTTGQGVAYWLIRTNRNMAGVICSVASLLIEQIGTVVILRQLGQLPYIVSLVMLLVAATTEARWLSLSFVSCLLALGIEGALSPWGESDRQAIVTAALFAAAVFVVSLLHVRGTERAFAVAEKREQARASAAAAAMDSERRYRLFAESTDDLIAMVDLAGRAIYLSPSHERVLGLSTEQSLGLTAAELLTGDNVRAAGQAFARTLEKGEARFELQMRRPDGTPRLIDARMKRVDAAPEAFVTIVGRDVTERRDLESRLQASERLEALGRLAGSVAHDFNNLLTVICGASELARASLPAQHAAVADLDAVMAAAGTATDLARQLLTFSRRQLLVSEQLDLASVLKSQHEVLARMVGATIRLEYEFEANLPPVWMPRAHVEQLAMNLARNAADAMPTGGRVQFAMRRRVLGDREVGDLVAGHYVELEVNDQGVGIPEDVLPHLFEPFFSTKGVRGTGLGLATCFSIVAQAGGTIRVASETGKGTTFRVFLPAGDGVQQSVAGQAVPRDVRRVLVLDDDTNVRDMTTRMLRSEGHEVYAASTLSEARRILESDGMHLDAMLIDVVLGKERGTDLLEECRRIRPQARIVVTSGYTPDPGASEALATHGAVFLPKPFGRDQLLRALRGGASPSAAAAT